MRVEKFKTKIDGKLSKIILANFDELSYNALMKVFRNKDIKVNGVRCGKDLEVNAGDEIVFYFEDNSAKDIEIVYEDENIVICNKPRKLLTISNDGTDSVLKRISDKIKSQCFAVHRLDRNTTGLVVFAKNEKAKQCLDEAFKNRLLEKYYLALVNGEINIKNKTLIAYLKKDEKNSIVKIKSEPSVGYDRIETKYSLLKKSKNISLLEIELVTGKTHQIRAHLAFIGHPILGDEKYGDSKINSKYKFKYQCLCSHKLIFHFEKNNYLSYLNGKVIELEDKKIDFLNLI